MNEARSSGLDSARLRAIDALLDRALDHEGPAREMFLTELTGRDVDAAARVRALLQSMAGASALDRPLVARADAADPADQADTAGVEPMPQAIGAWQLLEVVGRGGMATVYRARRQTDGFVQFAALKLLDARGAGFDARFRAEREMLAGLDHPHIARVLDGGLADDGRPWFAMAWIEGEDLDAWLERDNPSLDVRLALFEQIADAVAYAHRRLIVHRDLKPGNVLVTADGGALLLDFGIAKLIDEGAGEARTQALFTPEYAAPEQLSGGLISTATDIHGLGLLLFEILTGRRAFPQAADSLAAAIETITRSDVPLPSRVMAKSTPAAGRALRGDLDAIVQRCLAKAPEQRYASVDALIDDLARRRQRLPVRARRGAWRYRAGRWFHRHWLAASLSGLTLALLIAGIVVQTHQAQIVRAERDAARLEATRQEALREHLMLIFRDAGSDGQATAKELLDASAAQLDALYGKDPPLRRAVLLSMGELYHLLGDFAAARAMLERYVALADAGTEPTDLALALAQLAQTLQRLGKLDDAQTLLDRAAALRQATPDAIREIDALLVTAQSSITRARGDIAEGLRLQRHSVDLSRQAVDRTPMRFGVAQSNLGMSLLQANRLTEARQQYEQALSTWRDAGLEGSANALTAMGNLATIELLLGDLHGAERHFTEAETASRAVLRDSAATAALLSNHARVLLSLERWDEAQVKVERALEIAIRATTEVSVDVAAIRITAAEVALGRDDLPAARALSAQARTALVTSLGESHPLVARADAVAARIELAAGNQGALDRLQAAAARLSAGPPLSARQGFRAELSLLQAAHAGGQFSRARDAWRRAAALPFVVELPASEQAELRLWAAVLGGLQASGREALNAALVALEQNLGPKHSRVLLLRRLLSETPVRDRPGIDLSATPTATDDAEMAPLQ